MRGGSMRRLLTTLMATLAMATMAWGQATFDVRYYDVPKGGRPGEVWGATSGVDRLVVISTSAVGS